MDRKELTLIFLAVTIGGAAVMLRNIDAIDKENNAFAKDCNDRGGLALFEGPRQCVGAKPPRSHYERT
ncbi:hypothetical protein [Massilia sp.]|uniref:hypothetical protein n=1 Tax=Massilia sp. TaxID=1882437 RepID=UPI00352F326F